MLRLRPHPVLLAVCLATVGIGQARAVIGFNRDELVRAYGPVQEESPSVYGSQFTDLLFLTKSTTDGNKILIAATMYEGRCNAVSYVKTDTSDKPYPLDPKEVANQMIASSKRAGGVWKQINSLQWTSDPGPDVPGGMKARWKRPELFQIFTQKLYEKSGQDW